MGPHIRALTVAAQTPSAPTLVQVATVDAAGTVIVAPSAAAAEPARPVSRSPLPLPMPLAGPVAIEIRLAGGRTIAVGPGFDRRALRSVVELLEEISPCSI